MASTGEPFGLFWNSDNGDRTYDANSFEYWLKKFFTSGVFNGDLQVQATSGMTIKVGAGYANVDGKVKFWNAEFNLILSAANSTYPRIDTIVITRDNVNREIRCEVVTGSYSGDTPQPTAPVRNAEIYQLVLAQIYVANGATGITQAEITDTRPNTDLCGWITGTVTELDFEQFTVQFESYFAQFKRQHENEWSVWETTQKAAYAAWLSEVKAQQVQDKANWDAWYAALQEELHELPADTAEYLQIEIDEIKRSGTTGSVLHITTTNSELEGKTVTVTCGAETRTGTFDSNLECTIIGFKSVGTLTITSTDGIQTAVKTINIDYYSKYEVAIAFWAATVNIQGDDNLKGVDVVVKDSNNTTITTITLNAVTGQGVFEAQKADTYTFSAEWNGNTYTESLNVTQEITYSLNLFTTPDGSTVTPTDDIEIWLRCAEIYNTGYTTISEVLADASTLQTLIASTNAVDYMARSTTWASDVTADSSAMSYIGLNDYCSEALLSNSDWSTAICNSSYMTSVLDTKVPTMTSNTTPYGTAFAYLNNSTGNTAPYTSFDGKTTSTSSSYGSAMTASHNSSYVGYIWSEATAVKKATFHLIRNQRLDVRVKIQGSNDGETWIDLSDLKSITIPASTVITGSIITSSFAKYNRTRLYIEADSPLGVSGQISCHFVEVQFYGRT